MSQSLGFSFTAASPALCIHCRNCIVAIMLIDFFFTLTLLVAVTEVIRGS
jgi:hypothetical protein